MVIERDQLGHRSVEPEACEVLRTPAIVRWSSRRMVSYSGGAEDKALERGLLFRREIIARLEEHGR